MKFLPEVLNKFPDGIPYVSHQGITGILHVNPKLYLRKRVAWVTTDRKRSAIIEEVGAWRSLVAHLPWAQGVVGSNPIAPTNLFFVLHDASVCE
jgi:hypothetical protein